MVQLSGHEESGEVIVTVIEQPASVSGLTLLPTWFEIEADLTFGNAEVCLPYDPAAASELGLEGRPRPVPRARRRAVGRDDEQGARATRSWTSSASTLAAAQGLIARIEGNTPRARALTAESQLVAERVGDLFGLGLATFFGAKAALDDRDGDAAEEAARISLSAARSLRHHSGLISTLHTLAGAAALKGNPARGARLIGAAVSLADWFGFSLLEADAVDCARDAALVRKRLDGAAFAAARNEGARMTLDEAATYALADRDDAERIPGVQPRSA